MTTLTPERLAELREVAEAATPGPWMTGFEGEDFESGYGVVSFNNGHICEVWTDYRYLRQGDRRRTEADQVANALHIAAFDPPTCLALLAALAEAQEAVREGKDIVRESNMFRAERDRLAQQVSVMREAIRDHLNKPDYWDGLCKALDDAALAGAESEGK